MLPYSNIELIHNLYTSDTVVINGSDKVGLYLFSMAQHLDICGSKVSNESKVSHQIHVLVLIWLNHVYWK